MRGRRASGLARSTDGRTRRNSRVERCSRARDDVNSGIDNNTASCGAGNNTRCSTGGDGSDDNNRTIVWAR